MTDSYKMFSDPNLLAKIAGSPQTKHLLSDPSFMAKLHQVQQNPQLLQTEVLQDQRLMQVMVMLLGINMSAPPEGGEPMQTDEPVSPHSEEVNIYSPTQRLRRNHRPSQRSPKRNQSRQQLYQPKKLLRTKKRIKET